VPDDIAPSEPADKLQKLGHVGRYSYRRQHNSPLELTCQITEMRIKAIEYYTELTAQLVKKYVFLNELSGRVAFQPFSPDPDDTEGNYSIGYTGALISAEKEMYFFLISLARSRHY
jgi:hypothetical protein